MTTTGLLVVTNPSKLARILPIIQQKHVSKTLYVQYYPGRHKLLVPNSVKEVDNKSLLRRINIIGLYAKASQLCSNLDVRILLHEVKYPQKSPMINTLKKIQVVIFDRCFNADEVKQFSRNCLGNVSEKCQSVMLDDTEDVKGEDVIDWHGEPQENDLKMYENVVLGGTFDRLHVGHKTLLSEAVLRCSSKLTVGVTDTVMLKSKVLWELTQPCSERIKLLREFLQDIDPKISYDIVPITDPFGPTKDEPSFQLIIVSKETLKGGKAVNDIRAKNGLSTLDIHVVDLLLCHRSMNYLPEENEDDKISSSNQRLRLLGTRLKPPVPNPNLPDRPYVIGLTGGIASGKTHVGEYLRSLGAGVIFCDTLAHEVYKKGEPLYDEIVKEFGQQVVNAEGGEIDRKVLGGIVFKDEARLTKLNGLVWPELLRRVKSEVQKLYEAGNFVVVLEAAVLVMAGWEKNCHEIWTCIIPEEEAIRRQMERNALTAQEATRRVAMQPTNTCQVEAANVVFSSLWSHEYTERQVVRAWTTLQGDLRGRDVKAEAQ